MTIRSKYFLLSVPVTVNTETHAPSAEGSFTPTTFLFSDIFN